MNGVHQSYPLYLRYATIDIVRAKTKEHRTVGIWPFQRRQCRWVENELHLQATFDASYPAPPRTGDRVALITEEDLCLVAHIKNPVWVTASSGSGGWFECDSPDMDWQGHIVSSGRMVRLIKTRAHKITYAQMWRGRRKGRWFPE